MPPLIDLTGHRYGRLTVTGRAGTTASRKVLWRCQCDCGRTTTVTAGALRSGNTQSCGCLRTDTATAQLTTLAAQQRTTHCLTCGRPIQTPRTGHRTYCTDYCGRIERRAWHRRDCGTPETTDPT